MDKRNKTALAYLLVGVAAAGRALLAVPEGEEITPAQLREQTGLTQNQYKEAIRAPSVKELFRTEFITFGSGKNQKIRRVSRKNAA